MDNAQTETSAACGQSRSTVVLERCPFCNGEAAFGKTTYSSKTIREQHWGQDTFHSVNCILCGTSNRGLVGYRTQEEAAAHWNKRKYFDIACERIARAQAQGQLLPPEQKPAAVQEALL